jgi:hypothetical protein
MQPGPADTEAVVALAIEPDLLDGHCPERAWSGLRARLEVAEATSEISVLTEELDPRLLASELVLVCPELRAISLALLPDRDPDACLRRTDSAECRSAAEPVGLPAPAAAVAHTIAAPAAGRQGVRPLAVAALVHVAGQTLLTALTGATIFACLAGLVLLATSLR